MGFIKRLLVVLGIASIAATILRAKGKTTDSPQQGGWRQVAVPTDPDATATTLPPAKSAS